MKPGVKILIGLFAVMIMTWLNHGPLGQGEALINRLEAEARAAVAATELPGIEVRLGRDPLLRTATLSGPANDFQREGQGNLPGINDHVLDVDGISNIEWADGPNAGGVPLIVESMLLSIAAFAIGCALGWLLFGRRKKETYL